MKKIFLVMCLGMIAFSAFAQTFEIENLTGGNSDVFGEDFLTASGISLNDRLQAELKTKYAEGKIRAQLCGINTWNVSPEFNAEGFIQINPVDWISVSAGTSFFSQYAMKCGELFALDEKPSWCKLLKSGVSLYSEIPLGKKETIRAAAGIEFVDFNFDSLVVDAGAEYVMGKKFSAGISAKDITKGAYGKYTAAAGFKIDDLKINAAFAYNNTDSDVLPQETKYSAALSAKYKFGKSGFSLSGDCVTGFNNEYISASSLVTKTYSSNAVPFAAALKVDSDVSENISFSMLMKFTTLFNVSDSSVFTVLPDFVWNINDTMQLDAGIRNVVSSDSSKIYLDISVPLVFKIKFDF